jgi:membrane protein
MDGESLVTEPQPSRSAADTPAITEQPIAFHKLKWSQIGLLLEAAVNNAMTHRLPRLAASLAFYTMLSLAPLLIVVVAIAALAFPREAAIGQIVWQMQDLIGTEAAVVVGQMIKAAQKPTSGAIATSLGLLAIFLGASSVLGELRDAMNIIWEVRGRNITGRIRSLLWLLRSRTLAFLMVLVIGALLLAFIAFNAVVSAIYRHFEKFVPNDSWILHSGNFVISFVVIAILFATLYKYLPETRIDWADVFPGAAITALLFTIGKFLIAFYLSKTTTTSVYGAAGSLVVVLLWVYYSAQIFFFGAEFSHAYAEKYGSKPSERQRKRIELAKS